MEQTALTIVKNLQKAGYETYFAGGCVRDILIKKDPVDYDIVTSAKPDTIEKLLEHTIPIGKQFGVIIAIVNGHHFEIATFREDSKRSDGRRPHAISFKSAKEDAQRRDFTINGMFYDPVEKKIIDYVGGQKDLNEKLVRFIGNPEERIKEDHLRILRAVRFKNAFDFQYHPKTFEAIKKHNKFVKKISPERVRDELLKILKIPHLLRTFEDLDDTRVLEHILPEISDLKGVAQPQEYHEEGDVWTHTLKAVESLTPKCPQVLRLAVLFHDTGKKETFKIDKERIHFDGHASISADIAKKALKRLKFSRKEIDEVIWLIKHHMMMKGLAEMTDRRKIHWHKNPYFKNLLRVMHADIMGSKPSNFSLLNTIKDDHKRLKEEAKKHKPLLTGGQIIKKYKLTPGPQIGKILKEVEHLHLEEKIHTKREALKVVERILKK